MIVNLEDQRNLAREIPHTRLNKSEGRRVSVAPRFDGQLEMVTRIVSGRVHGKTSAWPMLESLIHRQNHQPPGSAELSVIEQPRQIRESPWIIAPVPSQNFLYPSGVHKRNIFPLKNRW